MCSHAESVSLCFSLHRESKKVGQGSEVEIELILPKRIETYGVMVYVPTIKY